MGLQESKIQQRKLTKSKSSLSDRPQPDDNFRSFVTNIQTFSCLRTTNVLTYQNIQLQKISFASHDSPFYQCTKILNSGSTIFKCLDCSTDQIAYLCEECFERGGHNNHEFEVFHNNNGWSVLFCRCGDLQYMKKDTCCQKHVKPQGSNREKEVIDKKQQSKFSAYFHQAFRILVSLMKKGRENQLLSWLFDYFQKITENNLYFSRILSDFLVQTNKIDGEGSNIRKFIKMGGIRNFRWSQLIRNLSFVKQNKQSFLRELIIGINHIGEQSNYLFYTLIINYLGSPHLLNKLAQQENLIVGLFKNPLHLAANFYPLILRYGDGVAEVHRCLVRNRKIAEYINHPAIIKGIAKVLSNQEEYLLQILEQIIELKNPNCENYIIEILMMISPQFFQPSLGGTDKKSSKSLSKYDKIQGHFISFYNQVIWSLYTYSQGQTIPIYLLLLLPFFNFGEKIINQIWSEVEKRVEQISKNKERSVISEATISLLNFVMKFLDAFMSWDHKILRDANSFELINFTKDEKYVEKAVIQYFDKVGKVSRVELLSNVDIYTQKQRSIVEQTIKKNLYLHQRKGVYYYVGKKLPNNSYNFDQLSIGSPFKFSEWQEAVSKKFFTETFINMSFNLAKMSQKTITDNMNLVKMVSKILVSLCLFDRSRTPQAKDIIRSIIKQIPDSRDNVYLELAKIKQKLQLDIQETQNLGRSGRKKVKTEVSSDPRYIKYQQFKQKKQKNRLKWLNPKKQSKSNSEVYNDYCQICKQKDDQNKRYVYPCNFTLNSVVSSILKSDVTDLDINICLHKYHESCFERERYKRQCPVCKFESNCYIPQRTLADQSFTKNWLRNFQNIVTSINLQSGKCFNTDWSTIFLTYLLYSKSLKVLLKNTESQDLRRKKTDELILMHYKSQFQKWPQLAKQAFEKAQKTVSGQVARELNIKKLVKGLVFDLVVSQITNQPIKNDKKLQKKFGELITEVGTENAQKIRDLFDWAKDNQAVKEIFKQTIVDRSEDLFKIKDLPDNTSQYIKSTSTKCLMCNQFQLTAWQCLFCSKLSCHNCISPLKHCETQHRGSGVIIQLNEAKFQLIHENRHIDVKHYYRNEHEEGWTRKLKPSLEWEPHPEQIYKFFDEILHSENPLKKRSIVPDDQQDNQDVIFNTQSINTGNQNAYGSNSFGQGGIGIGGRGLGNQYSGFNNSGGLFNSQPSGFGNTTFNQPSSFGANSLFGSNNSWGNNNSLFGSGQQFGFGNNGSLFGNQTGFGN